MPKEPKSELPRWVKEQQHQSWQIEILIASGLIFFLTQIPPYLGNWFASYAQATDFGAESVILLIGGLYFSRVLLIGFIINLVLRALWLAYLGVNFVYPNDINYEQLGYSDYFRQRMEQQADAGARIIRLEHLSSLSYSMTLMLTIMAFGTFTLLSVFFYVLSFIASGLYDSQNFGIFLMFLFFLFSLGLLDFLFFKLLKRYPKASRWYYPFYRFYSIVSLSFLFKREWLVLISNGKRWVIYTLFLIFFGVGFFLTANDVNQYVGDFNQFTLNLYEDRAYLDIPTYNTIKRQRYDNLLVENDKIRVWCLSTDVIREKSAWVFVVYDKWMDPYLQPILDDYDFQRGDFESREELYANDEKFSTALSRYFKLKIDDTPLEGIQWFYYRHHITNEIGFKAYFRTDSIASGNHRMHIDIYHSEQDTSYYRPYRTTAFFKE